MKIPCLHDTGAEPDGTREVPDHHPLTRLEIAEILDAAKDETDFRVVAGHQVRLAQGIVGYVCPRLIDGPVAMRERIVDHLFLDLRQFGSDPVLVDALWHAMRAGPSTFRCRH